MVSIIRNDIRLVNLSHYFSNKKKKKKLGPKMYRPSQANHLFWLDQANIEGRPNHVIPGKAKTEA